MMPSMHHHEDMNTTQTTLPMNFSNARIILPAMWATGWMRDERYTVVGVDADNYDVPMVRALFADGRIGLHTMAELARK